ncbi:coiled-coil domain-containing protein 96 isoform X1 [Dendroctonus ponderosae]|nr:coiled-coil domain-containing protein 96 isoform X1 [Dendroctonus ponderosae]
MSDSHSTGEQPNKEQFSNEIATEEYCVTVDDVETNEFEVSPKPSLPDVAEKELTQKVEAQPDDNIDLEQEAPEEKNPETEEPEKEKNDDNLEGGFFAAAAPEEAEKQNVVEEISGMTEISENASRTSISPEEAVVALEETTTEAEERKIEDSVEAKSDITRESIQVRDASESQQIPDLQAPMNRSTLAIRPSLMPRFHDSRPSRASSRTASRKSSFDEYRKDWDQHEPLSRSSARGTISSVRHVHRRDTMSYAELGPRIRGLSEADDDLTGFDMGGDAPIFFDETVEEEEQSIEEQEEIKPVLDREPYYARHDQAIEEINERKTRNFVIQKKLAMYFKRKKMDYVTKETDWSFDQQNKYNRKLEAYGELIDFVASERDRISQEIAITKIQRETKFKELSLMFKKIQAREGEIGYGLINTKTGNAIPDKLVDRLIHRQLIQMGQVSSMRLTFIKLKQMVQEKLDAIADLNEIAPGFLLADFEQLKVMNQSYGDKLEERDEELSRLRAKCASTIQILAHLREKSSALQNDVADLMEERNETEWEFFNVRSTLNLTKQHRDYCRHGINQMRDDSGLLTQPTLLRDMEQGLVDAKVLAGELQHVMAEYKKRARQIKRIRTRIEEAKEMRRLGRRSSLRVRNPFLQVRTERSDRICRGRPSLMMPTIEETAFDSLRSIKPKITYDRRRHPLNPKLCKRADG